LYGASNLRGLTREVKVPADSILRGGPIAKGIIVEGVIGLIKPIS